MRDGAASRPALSCALVRPELTNGAFMLDQIIGLILAILALIYLAYAMLRPERF